MSKELFLVLSMCYLTNEFMIRENVIFGEFHEISTTRSRWLVTLAVVLTVYDQSIDKLYTSLDEINFINNMLLKHYDVPLKDKYFQTFKGMELEIINLRTAQDSVYQSFQIFQPLHTLQNGPDPGRFRRFLLPIIGKAFSFLFGTVSEDDLRGIQTNLNGLASNQKKITHVLQQSLTIINSTRLAVQEEPPENR